MFRSVGSGFGRQAVRQRVWRENLLALEPAAMPRSLHPPLRRRRRWRSAADRIVRTDERSIGSSNPRPSAPRFLDRGPQYPITPRPRAGERDALGPIRDAGRRLRNTRRPARHEYALLAIAGPSLRGSLEASRSTPSGRVAWLREIIIHHRRTSRQPDLFSGHVPTGILL